MVTYLSVMSVNSLFVTWRNRRVTRYQPLNKAWLNHEKGKIEAHNFWFLAHRHDVITAVLRTFNRANNQWINTMVCKNLHSIRGVSARAYITTPNILGNICWHGFHLHSKDVRPIMCEAHSHEIWHMINLTFQT